MQIEIPPINWSAIGPPAVLAIWATLLLLVDLFVASKRVTAYLALLGLVVAAVVAIPAWNQPAAAAFEGMVVIDNTAILLDWILLLITAVTILFSTDYNERLGIERGEYYTILLFTTSAMMFMAHGRNLIVLFLALEWLSIGLYTLAGFAYPRIRSGEAATKYLLYGAFAAGFLIYGIALIYGATGTADMVGVAEALRSNPALQTDLLLVAGGGLVLIGFGYKISMVPFHMWTPDVYEGSPTPVAGYMSAATKVAGFAALLRVVQFMFPPDVLGYWRDALAVLAALSMIVGNLVAVAQTNIKRMLAYSSIAHAGFILVGLVAANEVGLQGFIYYLLAYGITNLGAFAVVIALENAGEERFDLQDLHGLGWRQPMLGAAMAIFMLSLAGIPPLAGFFAKLLVFLGAYQGGYWWLALIGLITSVISAFYYLRIIVNMYMREREEPARTFTTAPLLLGVVLAAVIIVVQGILAAPVLQFVPNTLAVVAP
jgi:NADH-quinone oxidoreductase subunit N